MSVAWRMDARLVRIPTVVATKVSNPFKAWQLHYLFALSSLDRAADTTGVLTSGTLSLRQ
jgi:hypothetical protein